MKEKKLDVYLDQNLVGELCQGVHGELRFTYHDDYLHHAKQGISISLPLTESMHTGRQVQAFFSGLLPDEQVRIRLAKRLGLSSRNAFSLLGAVGGECAGALSLYPKGQKPDQHLHTQIEVMDEREVQSILEVIEQDPLMASTGNARLSLAGAQYKLGIRFVDQKISLVSGAMPTTHILKPMVRHVRESVHNEYFCMKLAQKLGISIPNVSIYFAGETPCYIIDRYDRVMREDGTVKRIHQEDFCQALGIPPEMKYEREGGPSLLDCQKLVMQYAAKPARDNIRLLELILFNYVIGNADAHGKNFSFLYRESKPTLSPAYDLMSTAIYPQLTNKMAMKIGGRYDPSDVQQRHWNRIVLDTKVARSNLAKQLAFFSEQVLDEATTLIKQLRQDGIVSTVFDEILDVIKDRSDRIMKNINTKS